MYRGSIVLAAAASISSIASIALTATVRAEAPKPNPDLTKEVQELRAEVSELRMLVRALIVAEEKKSEALKQSLSQGVLSQGAVGSIEQEPGLSPRSEVGVQAPQRAEKAKTPAAKRAGTIAGSIEGLRANAWVYVADLPGRPVVGQERSIEQKNKQFAPRFMVVQKGTRVLFPNQDSIYHNVWSASPGNQFDLGHYRKSDATKGHDFITPGIVQVFCNIHSNMDATVVVVPNDLFVRADGKGAFTLSGVPAGRRKLVAVAEGAQPEELAVDVEADGTAHVTFNLKAKPFGPHLNKDGRPYAAY